jgi:hypothetical protein
MDVIFFLATNIVIPNCIIDFGFDLDFKYHTHIFKNFYFNVSFR